MWNNIKTINSNNAFVKKYIFEKDDAVAESVLYKYPTYRERTVICCSTQSGCPVGCRFCGAGDNFVRSLTSDEIVSQPVKLLEDVLDIEGCFPNEMNRLQIMFMSMGEPMLNMKALLPAIVDLYSYFPTAALLVSTMGPLVEYKQFHEVSAHIPTVGLQFSVHETTDEARDKLIPFESKMTLQEIADTGDWWFTMTNGRMPYFNYCVHEKNNTDEDAERLLTLFDPIKWNATISVICERDEHVGAANERQRSLANEFMAKLRTRGFSTRVFDPAGQDDACGCGQLWETQKWMRDNPTLARPSVGNGLPIVHVPSSCCARP